MDDYGSDDEFLPEGKFLFICTIRFLIPIHLYSQASACRRGLARISAQRRVIVKNV